MICHSKVHNLYGYNMTRAAGEAFRRLCPDKRILMFLPLLLYRYAPATAASWTGDNNFLVVSSAVEPEK